MRHFSMYIVVQRMVVVFDRVENVVGKYENASNQSFLSFP